VDILLLPVLKLTKHIENKVNNIKDRKIINIYAGIEGPLEKNQFFSFGDGGNSFLLTHPGHILSFSLVSLRVILSPNSLFSTGITANRVLGIPSR
jgi:hypothetical protein